MHAKYAFDSEHDENCGTLILGLACRCLRDSYLDFMGGTDYVGTVVF